MSTTEKPALSTMRITYFLDECKKMLPLIAKEDEPLRLASLAVLSSTLSHLANERLLQVLHSREVGL